MIHSILQRIFLRGGLILLILFSLQIFVLTGRAQTAAPKPAQQPFVVEYYYKTRWGFADEFIRLFKKNHFPLLKKQVESGRILLVSAVKPRYHNTEDGRWDYRVTITFKNLEAAFDPGEEDALTKQLYPDQETYKREEQRRFEILLGHWDVPVTNVALDQ